jgi:hypothetical protein
VQIGQIKRAEGVTPKMFGRHRRRIPDLPLQASGENGRCGNRPPLWCACNSGVSGGTIVRATRWVATAPATVGAMDETTDRHL